MDIGESLQRIFYREFLLEPQLYMEAGLEDLPRRLATILDCNDDEALERAVQSPTLDALTLEQLKDLLKIRDMSLVSRTAAALSAELKAPDVSYDSCIRMALCYGVIGHVGHVFSALRAAAAKHEQWARHHYLYGLLLGIQEANDRACWEMGMALKYEPFAEGRVRIQRVYALMGCLGSEE